MEASLNLPGFSDGEASASKSVGFSAPPAAKREKLQFLTYHVSEGDGWGYHAMVNGKHYGPFDSKQECIDQVCMDLSSK